MRTRPGAGPRHLAFHPDGRRLYAINQLDNTVVFRIDRETGKFTAVGEPVTVTSPSCIAVVP